jgi:hypothetical protein
MRDVSAGMRQEAMKSGAEQMRAQIAQQREMLERNKAQFVTTAAPLAAHLTTKYGLHPMVATGIAAQLYGPIKPDPKHAEAVESAEKYASALGDGDGDENGFSGAMNSVGDGLSGAMSGSDDTLPDGIAPGAGTVTPQMLAAVRASSFYK